MKMNSGFFLWRKLAAVAVFIAVAGMPGRAIALPLLPTFGVQAGVSLASLTTPSNISSSSLTGFAGGVVAEIPLAGGVFIQPEALFVMRGASLVDANGTKLTARYNSLEIPVLLKIKVGQGIQPFFFIGPNFNFNLSNSLSIDTPGATSGVSFTPNALDIAGTLGAGVEIGPIFVDLRYELGFIQINSNSASWASRGFLALVGLKF